MDKKIKKQKTYGKAFAFNTVFIAIIILLTAGAVFYAVSPKNPKTVDIEYRVVFENLDKNAAEKILPGKEVFLADGTAAGIIKEALNERAELLTPGFDLESNAVYIKSYSNERNTVSALISFQAKFDGGAYYAGGQPLRAGDAVVLRLAEIYSGVKIISVSLSAE